MAGDDENAAATAASIARGLVDGSVALNRTIESQAFGAKRDSLGVALASELENYYKEYSFAGSRRAKVASFGLWLISDNTSSEAATLARHLVHGLEDAAIRDSGREFGAATKRCARYLKACNQGGVVFKAAEQQTSSTVALALLSSLSFEGAVELFVERRIQRSQQAKELDDEIAVHEALKPMVGLAIVEEGSCRPQRKTARELVDELAMKEDNSLQKVAASLARSLRRSPGSSTRVCELLSAARKCRPEDATLLAIAAAASSSNAAFPVFAAISKFSPNTVSAAARALCSSEENASAASWFSLSKALSVLVIPLPSSSEDSLQGSDVPATAEGAIASLLSKKADKNDESMVAALTSWGVHLDTTTTSLAKDVSAYASKELGSTTTTTGALRLIASVVEAWKRNDVAVVKASELEAVLIKIRKKATTVLTNESRKDHTLCLYALSALKKGVVDWTKDEGLAFSATDPLDYIDLAASCGLARLSKLKNCPLDAQQRAWTHVAIALASTSAHVREAATDAMKTLSSSSSPLHYKSIWRLVAFDNTRKNLVTILRRLSSTDFSNATIREYAALATHHCRVVKGSSARRKLWQHIVAGGILEQGPARNDELSPIKTSLTSGREDEVEAAGLALEALFHTAAHFEAERSVFCSKAALDALISDLEESRKLSPDDLKAYLGRVEKEEDAPSLFAKSKSEFSSASSKQPMPKKKKKKDDTSALLAAVGGSPAATTKKSAGTAVAPPAKQAVQAAPTFESIVASASARIRTKSSKAKATMRAIGHVARLAPTACQGAWPSFLPTAAEVTANVAAELNVELETDDFDEVAAEVCASIYGASVAPKTPSSSRQTGRALAVGLKRSHTRWSAEDEVVVASTLEDVAAHAKGIDAMTPFARLASRLACAALEQSAASRSRRPKGAIEVIRALSPVLGTKARAAALEALIVSSSRSGDDKEPAAEILSLCGNAPETDAHVLVPPLLGVGDEVVPVGIFDSKARVRCGVLAACLILVSRCGVVFDADQMVRVWITSFWGRDGEDKEVPEEANLIDELSDVFADSRDLLPRDVFGCRGATNASDATVEAKARMLAREAWSRMLEDHSQAASSLSTPLVDGVQIDVNFKVSLSSITRVALADDAGKKDDDIEENEEFDAVRGAARAALASLTGDSSAASAINKHLCDDFDRHRQVADAPGGGGNRDDPEAHLMLPPGADLVKEARELEARRAMESRKIAINARRRERVAKTLAVCLQRENTSAASSSKLLGWVRSRLGDPDARTRQALLAVGTAIVDMDVDASLDELFALSQQPEENSVIRLGLTALLGRAAKSLGEGDERVAAVADRLIAALTSSASEDVHPKKQNALSESAPPRKKNVTKDFGRAAPVTGAAAISGLVGSGSGVSKKLPFMNANATRTKRQATALRTSLTETTKRKASAAELQRRQAGGNLSEASSATDGSAVSSSTRSYKALAAADEAAQRSIADGLVPIAKSLKKHGDGERAGELVDRLSELCFGGGLVGSALRRTGAARGLAAAIKGIGIAALKQRGVVGKIEMALIDSSSIDDKHGGLVAVECLAERLGVLFEPYEIALLPSLLRCFGDGTELVREAAKSAARKVFEGLSAHGVKLALPTVLAAAAGTTTTEDGGAAAAHWRPRVAAIGMLGTAAHCAPKQLGAVLPKAVPALASALGDTHPKVREAAKEALADVGSVAKNPEIRVLRPVLLDALADPAHSTRDALDALLSREFAHALDAPSVALVAPVIQRGLRDRLAETKRRSALVLGNLAAMSSASADAIGPHATSLQPLLEAAAVSDAHPDVRFASAISLAQLVGALGVKRMPFVVERLCNAALARRASPSSGVGDIIPDKSSDTNGGLLAGAASGGSERSGAAQALAAVLRELGDSAISETFLEEIVPVSKQTSAAGREGALYVVRFLSRDEDFSSDLVPDALSAILDGLADDADSVREAAFFAGKQLVRTHGESELGVLLPSLEGRLTAPAWRIRAASATLIGELLILIGNAKHVGISERDKGDDALGDEATAATIEQAIGKSAWRNILASLYIARLDAVAAVRAAALQVWKTVVPSTPRALREILPTLVKRLVYMLAPDSTQTSDADAGRRRRQAEKDAQRAKDEYLQQMKAAMTENSENAAEDNQEDDESDEEDEEMLDATAERQRVASRTLGDIVTKIGDRVIPELIPFLHDSFDTGDEATRVGVCLGLAEVAAAASSRQAIAHLDSLSSAILRALSRPHGEETFSEVVIAHAAVAFHELHGTAGPPALTAIIPGILEDLDDESTSAAAIVALREISRRRARELLAVVVPKLLESKPISKNRANAASAIADVAGSQLGPYVGSLSRAVIADLVNQEEGEKVESPSSEEVLECAADVAASAALAGDASSVLGQLASPFLTQNAAQRKCAATLAAAFFKAIEKRHGDDESRSSINDGVPRLLKELLSLLAEPSADVRGEGIAALAAYSSATPVNLQLDHLEFVRMTLSSTASDARIRLKREIPMPGISEDSSGLVALLPPYLHALLHASPEKRESAALGIAELVDLASEQTLKRQAVKIAGPLIRVVGDRFGPEVRAAVLQALEALLKKGPTLVKAFVPQLTPTATKHVKDPSSRNVRARALKLLELLVPLTTRFDAMVLDLARAVRDAPYDNSELQLALLRATKTVIDNKAGKTLSESAKRDALAIVEQFLEDATESAEDAVVKAAESLRDTLS